MAGYLEGQFAAVSFNLDTPAWRVVAALRQSRGFLRLTLDGPELQWAHLQWRAAHLPFPDAASLETSDQLLIAALIMALHRASIVEQTLPQETPCIVSCFPS